MTAVARTIRAHPMEPALRRFGAAAELSPAEIQLVERLGPQRDLHRIGAEVLSEGAPVRTPRLILSGWALRQRLLPDGRRQIFGFLVPGDGIAFCAKPHPLAMASTIALTRLETVDASPLIAAAATGDFPGLAAVLDASSRIDEARLLDNVVRLGRQTAYERVGHLLLELRDRLRVIGQADEKTFPLPATQEVLADALGLSVVHVNRILQQLRRENLIQMNSSRVTLLDIDQLVSITEYRRTA